MYAGTCIIPNKTRCAENKNFIPARCRQFPMDSFKKLFRIPPSPKEKNIGEATSVIIKYSIFQKMAAVSHF